jgi:hypothetical protein
VTAAAEAAGFNPNDPNAFLPPGNLPPVPDIALPTVEPGEWSPGTDPYLAYADNVMARFQATMSGPVVVQRATFLDLVREWEYNQQLFEAALEDKPQVTPQEYLAFAHQRQRVADFIHTRMADGIWFNDAPVPELVKELVDVLAGLGWYDRAVRLQRNLNEWQGELTPQQGAVVEMVALLSVAMREPKLTDDPSTWDRLLAATDVLIDLAKIGVSFTPLGDVLDLCEAVTGWESCNPAGRTLTPGERVIAAAGLLVMGSTSAVRHVAERLAARRSGSTYAVLAGVLEESRDVAKGRLPASGGRWKGMRGESIWESAHPDVLHATGGKGVRFKNGYARFEPFAYDKPLRVKGLTGCGSDTAKMLAEVAGYYGLGSQAAAQEWLNVMGLKMHHVEDGLYMLLVPAAIHDNVPHEGGASMLRRAHGLPAGC